MKLDCVRVIGGKGSRPDQFQKALRGIGVGPADRVYAVGDREVKVFDHNGGLDRRWSTAMVGRCLAVDAEGNVYVGQTGQVERFDGAGKATVALRDADRLGRITALAIGRDQFLVADASNRCIRRYDGSGKWLNDIGGRNNTRGFLIPNGRLDFCVDPEGMIRAVNPAKHRVERYTADGQLRDHFGRFGNRPEDFPGCCNPVNLALTPRGELVVIEKAAPRLKVYDAGGRLLAVTDAESLDPNCKNMDLAVDSRGRIYVADTVRMQIAVFQRDDVAARPATDPAAAVEKFSSLTSSHARTVRG